MASSPSCLSGRMDPRTVGGLHAASQFGEPDLRGIRETPAKIPVCEQTYTDHGLATVFKITPHALELGLDDLLARWRYEKRATTRVQILNLNVALELADEDIEVLDELDETWMSNYSHLKRMNEREALKNQTILDRIGLPKRFVSILQDDRRVVSGIAVVESGCSGL